MKKTWECTCGETWEGRLHQTAGGGIAMRDEEVWVATHKQVKTCPSCELFVNGQEGLDWQLTNVNVC